MKKILIVDDDELILKSIKNLLKKNDWLVDVCSDPLEAFEKIFENQYDCLLLDVRMPRLNGSDLLEKIRDFEKQGKIDSQQIIFLTGYADETAHDKALQHGVFNYLYKPFDATDFLKCLENCLNAKKIIEANYSTKKRHALLDKKDDFIFNDSELNLTKKHVDQITLEDIGAKINAVSPEELFWWYAKTGFFYPSKKRKLTPYLSLVEANWKKALSLGEEIFWIATVEDPETSSWASVCNWRSTYSGWISQHLISSGNAAYPLMLMLGTQIKVINETSLREYKSFQNWYRPTNKYANKVFGLLGQQIDKKHTHTTEYKYFTVDLKTIQINNNAPDIISCGNKSFKSLIEFLMKKRDSVFIQSEELDQSDIELQGLNEIYQKVGLQRRRFFWLAIEKKGDFPIGAAIVYRAPVGLNFSMLENRCEIIIDTGLSDEKLISTTLALLKHAGSAYADFPASFIPVIADEQSSIALNKLGFSLARSYNQFIWTQGGYWDWYKTLFNLSQHAIERWRKYQKNNVANKD